MDGQNDSIVLEEEIDPNYEPTEREVLEYATWLGMDLENEQDLFWIAREGLKARVCRLVLIVHRFELIVMLEQAPLPENWKPCKTTDTEEIYYFNFATGQSTWDHPCDEFYRNLYEDNKKKRPTGKSFHDSTDEKKKKEKEDVAELLGRKGSGKKKKNSAKTEPLGPPVLAGGKSNPLEKKPLPGLSSKLGGGGLGALGGPSAGGLRPVGGGGSTLGRLRGESKDLDNGDGSDEDDAPVISIAGLSKPPLGGLLIKKSLPSSSSSSASLSRADSKVEMDGLQANFEKKKQKMLDDQAHVLQELEETHTEAMSALQKKMQKQLEELQDDEDNKLKQKKRELDKKRNELENQFDTDESSLLRERKEKLKKLEHDVETALAQKHQDLGKETQKETDRIQVKHEERLRELQEAHKKEDKQLQAKLDALLGEKSDRLNITSELKAEVDKLKQALASLESESQRLRDENDALVHGKANLEKVLVQAQHDMADLKQKQAAAVASASASASVETIDKSKTVPDKCVNCETFQTQAKKAEAERDQVRAEVEKCKITMQECEQTISALNQQIDEIRQTSQVKATDGSVGAAAAERNLQEKDKEIAALREQEAKLIAEITAIRAQQESVAAELAVMNTKCDRLRAEKSALAEELELAREREKEKVSVVLSESTPASVPVPENDALLEAAQAEIANLKNELSELQEQLTVLSKTNVQIKEQLLKESNEKKSLREQLDSKADQLGQELSKTIEDLRAEVKALEAQLDDERSSRSELTEACDQLRKEKQEVEVEKRKADSELARLDDDKQRLESEKAVLSRQLKELNDSLKQQEHSSAVAGNAEVTNLKFEIEQLEASLKMVESEKARHAARIQGLERELESSVAENHQLTLDKESEQSRCKRVESERDTLTQRVKRLEDDFAALDQKLQAAQTETADVNVQLNKTRLKEQAATEKNAQLANEIAQLELRIQSQASEKQHLESEKALLSRHLNELSNSLKQQEQSSAVASNMELTKQKYEIEQLKTTLKMLESDKAYIATRVQTLEREVESSTAATHQLTLDKENEQIRFKKVEAERTALSHRVKSLEDDYEACEQKLRSTVAENADVKAQLGKSKLKEQASTEKVTQLTNEVGQLEQQTQSQQVELDKVTKDIRTKQNQIDLKVAESSELRAENEVLRDQVSDLESSLADVKANLENRIRLLRSENSEQDVQAKHYEDDLSRTSENVKKLEAQLSETQLKWKRECSEKEILNKQTNVLNAAREELEGTIASMKRKLDAAESKWKDHESVSTRDDFQLKLKLQQTEADREALLTSKERVEFQLKAVEKELAATKDERVMAKEDSNSLRARIKTLASEKDEIQAALLSANLAQASSSSASSSARISGFAHATSSEAMLVKLQLADVNKNELEAHLADVASQLEISNRRCAALEARCRDQAVDMESLHVEVSSLRAATQKMHLPALETLSLIERLDYEHKKRALKSDFLSQLRDFQEREDQALIRHKARLRSQYEKQLDDLVAELEKKKQIRMEQEGAATLQMIEQIRQEREVKCKELTRQVREEMQDLEQELMERKEHHLQTIVEAIRKEEEALGSRLRESRQALREEELVRAARTATTTPSVTGSKQQSKVIQPLLSPGEVRAQHLTFEGDDNGGARDSDPNNEARKNAQDGFASSSPRRKSFNNGKTAARLSFGTGATENQTRHHLTQRRRSKNSDANSREYRKWSQRLLDENNLLSKAKLLISNQRRELKKQGDQLRRDKEDWKRDRHTTRHPQQHAILDEIKHMIEQNTAAWNQSVRQLREREAWIKRREQNIAKMQRIVDKLRLTRSRRRTMSNNHSGYLTDNDEEDEDENRFFSDGEGNQSEIGSLLDTLEKLDEELVSEVGELSEDLLEETRHKKSPKVSPTDRYRGWDGNNEHQNYADVDDFRHYLPMSYMMPPALPSDFAAASAWRYPDAALRGYPSVSRVPTRRPRGLNSNDRVPERVDMFQRQISRWAKDREKVQHAATKHASWLSEMCQELKEYGAKYKDNEAARDSAAAITILEEGDDNGQ
uniref:WW domain-containing protein n=1 Tax=Globisporangium ultimum (strain ATCC 200006 / CBS 805.95 / DAOM BR144) TaxID=431595 RepID=K3WV85_GLOUD